MTDFTLTLVINSGITNPVSIFNDATSVTTRDTQGNTIDSNTSLYFTYQPAVITNLTIDNLIKNPSDVTDLLYNFSPAFSVPTGSSIRLDFPYFNDNSGAPALQVYSVVLSINGGSWISDIKVYKEFKAFF